LTKEEWAAWDNSTLAPIYNNILIDFDALKVVTEKKETKKIAASIERQNKKVVKKTGKTNKSWNLTTISRNRLSLPSAIVKMIHARPSDDLFMVVDKNTMFLYKKLPRHIDEDCVYKVDKDNQVCISEVRLKEIGGGTMFNVSVENNAILIKKGKNK